MTALAQYQDSWAGFLLDRPAGWEARVNNGVITVRPDPASLISVLIWPLRLPQPIAPMAVAQQFVSLASRGNPTVKAWLVGQEPLVFRTEQQNAGRVLEGLYSVAAQADSCLITGFQAPREDVDSLAPLLKEVVASFRPAPAIPRQPYREPTEGAFTALYPQGWSVRGGVDRGNAFGAAMPYFQVAGGAASADNWMTSFSFAESWLTMMPGQQSLAYTPAPAFARSWLAGWLQKQTGPLTVEQVVDRPDEVPLVAIELAKAGISPEQCDLSAATLQYAQPRNGQPFRSRLGVVVQRSRAGGVWGMGASGWVAMITSSMHAPLEEFDGIEPVLTGVLASFQKDPQWEQAELMRSQQVSMRTQQEMSNRLRQISQTLSQTTDIINATYWDRQAAEDRVAHNFSNALLGRTDVRDSQGTTFSVPNDFDQYWRDPQQTIHGTGWLFNPDPTWERLEPVGPQ